MEFEDIKKLTIDIIDETKLRLVGYEGYMKSILRVLFANGHVILEGNPGIAKTLAANTLAEILGVEFGRIQFTPDLMPTDITGVNVFNQKRIEFEYLEGPVFTNFLLCDEINRSPPKTQAALLEAMQERQVTVEGLARKLPNPFLVIATQNPLEQSGTYNLPEAQIDRFLIRLIIDLPPKEVEKTMLRLKDQQEMADVKTLLDRNTVLEIQHKILTVKISDEVIDYIVDITHKTRDNPNVEIPASPRASIAMMQLGKANAAMNGRDYVQPDDVKNVAFEVLNHRVGLSHEAELDRISIRDVVQSLLKESTVSI